MFIADDGMNVVLGGPGSSIIDTYNFKGFWPNKFKRIQKIGKIFGKDLESGYVFAPYITQTTTSMVYFDP